MPPNSPLASKAPATLAAAFTLAVFSSCNAHAPEIPNYTGHMFSLRPLGQGYSGEKLSVYGPGEPPWLCHHALARGLLRKV